VNCSYCSNAPSVSVIYVSFDDGRQDMAQVRAYLMHNNQIPKITESYAFLGIVFVEKV
jgi:hypothetical protein